MLKFKVPPNLFLALLLAVSVGLSACAPKSNPSNTPTPATGQPGDQLTGPGEGGGGDPDTQSFIILGRKLAAYFAENPSQVELPFRPDAFAASVGILDESIKDPMVADLVEFTSETLKDHSQVSKVALFNLQSGSIRVHRPYWSSASDEDKLVLVAMEVAGLLGLELRYERARALVHDRTAVILAMALPNDGEKTPINWRIAEQDPDIFARMTVHDVIIDGGVIGTGSELNKRVVRFLADPLQDEEWMARAQEAFARKMPAYLLLRDEAGQSASITGFREYHSAGDPTGRPGIAIYSMLFRAKSVQVGSCSHTSVTVTPLERLKSCFFDVRFYNLWDAQGGGRFNEGDVESRRQGWQNSFRELSNQLISHYAKNTTAMAVAVQNAIVQDYSSLFPPFFSSYVLREASLANGLKPTLLKGETAFWETTTMANPKSVRFFAALEVMAKDRVGFLPGYHPNCLSEVDGQLVNASPIEPQIVPLAELHRAVREQQCILRDATNLDPLFYRALAQAGYVYDLATQTWAKKPPRTISAKLMMGQFQISRELETRVVAENLSAQSLITTIEQTLRASGLVERLAIYLEVLPHWQAFGLSQAQGERLYRLALVDIVKLGPNENPEAQPEQMVWRIGRVFPLVDFVRQSLGLAISNRLLSPGLSAAYVDAIMAAEWLNSEMSSDLIYNHFSSSRTSNLEFPYFEKVMSELLRRPFFDQDLATELVRNIVMPYYGLFAGRGTGTVYSYTDLNSLLQKVLALNKLNSESLLQIKPYIPTLQKAAEFERQAKDRRLNADAQARLLSEMLITADDAVVLADVVIRLLILNPVSAPAKEQLIRKLLRLGEDVPASRQMLSGFTTPSGLMPTISELPFLVELSRETQEYIFEWIVVRMKGKGASVDWARHVMLIRLFDHRDWLAKQMPGAQRGLELIVENSTELKNDLTAIEGRPEWEFTEVDRILNGLQACREPERRQLVCGDLTDTKRILQRIVINQKIPAGLRQRAAAVLN